MADLRWPCHVWKMNSSSELRPWMRRRKCMVAKWTIILYYYINHYLRLFILIMNVRLCLLGYQIFRMSLKLIPHCLCTALVQSCMYIYIYIYIKYCLYHCILTVHMISNNKINLFNLIYMLTGPCLNQIMTCVKADWFNLQTQKHVEQNKTYDTLCS